MSIIQKNPFSVTSVKPLYTLELEKTIVIIGLGNDGKKYEKTRHNIGFLCLDEFAKAHEFDAWVDKQDFMCRLAIKTLADSRVVLVKPTTMMNLSGKAASAVANFYKAALSNIVAVYDDYAIPFGQIRTRIGGDAAGHKGVKSLIQHIGNEFGRVRIGIRQDFEPNANLSMADFVLTEFSKSEQNQIRALTHETTDILTQYVYGGHLEPETRGFIV